MNAYNAPLQSIIAEVLLRLTNLTAAELTVVSGLEYHGVLDALTRMYRRGLVLRRLDRKVRNTARSDTKIYRYKLVSQGTPADLAREQRRTARRKAASAYRQTPERAIALRQQWSTPMISAPEQEAALEEAMRAPAEHGHKAMVIARAAVTLQRLMRQPDAA